jgi:hypothetical protein
MQITTSKIASLVVAAIYVVVAIISEGGLTQQVGVLCLTLLIPLVLIWFPEELGAFTGLAGRGYINSESPALLVAVMGWFFLVGLPLLVPLLVYLVKS